MCIRYRSKDGWNLTATINTRTQLNHDSVPVLHKFLGPDYLATVVRPEVGSRARDIISKYTAEQVYSTKRQEIEEEIRKGTGENLILRLSTVMQPEASEQMDAFTEMELYRKRLQTSIAIIDVLVLGIDRPK